MTDLIGVAIAEVLHPGIDFTSTSAGSDDFIEFVFRRRSDPHAQAIVGQNLEFFDVVDRLPRHDGMDATRIVADHAAKGAVTVSSWVRSKRQLKFLGRIPKIVQDCSRLDPSALVLGVDCDDLVHVFRVVDNDGSVRRLPGECSATSTGRNWYTVLATNPEDLDDIAIVTRYHHANRYLPVI